MAEQYTVDEVVSFLSRERVLPDYSSSRGSDVESTRKSVKREMLSLVCTTLQQETYLELAMKLVRPLLKDNDFKNTAVKMRILTQKMKVSLKKMLAVIQFFISSLLVVPLPSESDEESSSSDFSNSNCVPDPSSDSELDTESATPTDSDGSITQGTVRQSCVGRRSRGGVVELDEEVVGVVELYEEVVGVLVLDEEVWCVVEANVGTTEVDVHV